MNHTCEFFVNSKQCSDCETKYCELIKGLPGHIRGNLLASYLTRDALKGSSETNCKEAIEKSKKINHFLNR